MVANPDPARPAVELTPAQHLYIDLRACLTAVESIAAARAIDPDAYPFAGQNIVDAFCRLAFDSVVAAGLLPEGFEGEFWRYAARNGRLT